MELRNMENKLFEMKTRNEIMVVPLREYIEDWLRKYLIQTTELEQQETIVDVMSPQPQQESTKEVQLMKQMV